MNQYNEISTLQYMGSKTRIISHICEPIIKNKSIKTVVDLFAGTGSVGYALKAHKNIISNDLEYYAYIINHAILNGCDFSVTDEISFWNAVEQQSASLQAKVCTAVTTENKFFIDTVDYKQYQLFCEKTPSVFMPQSDDPRLKEILDLVDQVTPGKAPTVETPCLFLTYYANAYFGIAQCCQIDAIRSNIGQIEDKRTRYVLLTMLMSVMSASASTTTHFAQYLKVKSKATCNNLIGKRKINIIESCKSLLAEYRQAGLCTADRKAPSVCYNLDFSDCLDSISLNNETLVYADPPYFKEHYSRYYHVLNTVCLYDYPAMAMNPQTHELSIGRYREDRSVSDFGKKAKALGAFDTLITKCSNAGAWLMISYSDNSIVDISDIQWIEVQELLEAIAEKYNRPHRKTNALLAGLAHCPHCGRRLSVISESDRWTNGKPRFKYVCPGYRKKECNFKAVDGVLLDEFVVQQLSELSDENSERFRSILEIKIEEVLEQSQTVQEHNLIKKKRDKLKADIAAQTRNLREADGSIKQFIQEDLQNLAEELRETERQLSKLDEGRKNNMIAIRDLEMTKERLLSFAEYAKDAQPEVLVNLIQTIVERIYIVDKDDERYCHIFIKGCSGEDYTGFFQTAGYIEQKTKGIFFAIFTSALIPTSMSFTII